VGFRDFEGERNICSIKNNIINCADEKEGDSVQLKKLRFPKLGSQHLCVGYTLVVLGRVIIFRFSN
jgi:hypothetical protein